MAEIVIFSGDLPRGMLHLRTMADIQTPQQEPFVLERRHPVDGPRGQDDGVRMT